MKPQPLTNSEAETLREFAGKNFTVWTRLYQLEVTDRWTEVRRLQERGLVWLGVEPNVDGWRISITDEGKLALAAFDRGMIEKYERDALF